MVYISLKVTQQIIENWKRILIEQLQNIMPLSCKPFIYFNCKFFYTASSWQFLLVKFWMQELSCNKREMSSAANQ